jgi:hypothetical protein
MGGSNSDAEFKTGWKESHPELASKMDTMSALMSQGKMSSGGQPLSFNKMDSWQVGDAHPEAVGQGLNAGIQTGVSLGTNIKRAQKGNNDPGGGGGGGGKSGQAGGKAGGVDEYGYPYSIDSSGQRVYDVGSKQVDSADSFEKMFGFNASPED